MEKAFFFKNQEGANLFGILHYPKNTFNNIGLVVCAPFAEEKHESYRVLVNCARFLAKRGLFTLRFDYYGSGDSEGEWQNSTINSRLSDIKSAVQFLRKKISNIKIGLLGLRFGATLAALAAEKNRYLSFLILWQPLLDLREYLYQCLRSNLTTQVILYNKIRHNREALIEQLNQGKLINLDGFMLSQEMHQQASAINLLSQNLRFSRPVFIGNLENNKNDDIMDKLLLNYQQNSKQTQLFGFDVPHFWQEGRPVEIFDMNPIMLFETTYNWLISSCDV
ncbi:MAG: serine aminopeptidase domain-containing protein [Candidatus Hodarchaeota archaeon]